MPPLFPGEYILGWEWELWLQDACGLSSGWSTGMLVESLGRLWLGDIGIL